MTFKKDISVSGSRSQSRTERGGAGVFRDATITTRRTSPSFTFKERRQHLAAVEFARSK